MEKIDSPQDAGISLIRPLSEDDLARRIFVIRGAKVMLDNDLAALYGVTTKAFNQAVRRNLERFPPDFRFEITEEEYALMRSQAVTASRRNVRFRPVAFTEYGIGMLSGVLQSPRAVQVNIAIMRAFGQLREAVTLQMQLSRRLDDLETRYDGQFTRVFDAIRELMRSTAPPPLRLPADESGT